MTTTTPPLVIQEIPVNEIERNPLQPRTTFDEAKLEELAANIKDVGVLEPIVVRPVDRPTAIRYQLVMGERRWRATRLAGLPTIPAVIRETASEHLLRDALLENILREDLTPLEEAAAYEQLRLEHDGNQRDLAEMLKVSQSKLSKRLSLLVLPDPIRDAVDSARITIERGEHIARLSEEALDAIAFGEISLEHLLELLDAADDLDTVTTALVSLPEGVLETVATGQVSIPQLVQLTRLEAHPEVIADMLSATTPDGDPFTGDRLDRAIEQAILDVRAAQLRAELLDRGVRVLDDPPEGRGGWLFENVWPLKDRPHAQCVRFGDHLDLTDHDGKPCHAIVICHRHAEQAAVCTDPGQHGDEIPIDSLWRQSHRHLFELTPAPGAGAAVGQEQKPPTDPATAAPADEPTAEPAPAATVSDKDRRDALKQAVAARLDALANSTALDPNGGPILELVKLREGASPAATATLDLLAWTYINDQLTWETAPLICELLCVPHDWYPTPDPKVTHHINAIRRAAAQSTAALYHVAVVAMAASMEVSLRCRIDDWKWVGPDGARYMTWLQEHAGHVPSELEREQLAGLQRQLEELHQQATPPSRS